MGTILVGEAQKGAIEIGIDEKLYFKSGEGDKEMNNVNHQNDEEVDIRPLIKQRNKDLSILRLEDNVASILKGDIEGADFYIPNIPFEKLVETGRIYMDKSMLVESIRNHKNKLFNVGGGYFFGDNGILYFQIKPESFKSNGYFDPITYIVPVEKIDLTRYLEGYN